MAPITLYDVLMFVLESYIFVLVPVTFLLGIGYLMELGKRFIDKLNASADDFDGY